MKSILCGIVAIMCASLIAWAIAPWLLLLLITRHYQIEVKPRKADFPFETVEVKVEEEQPEVIVILNEEPLEDYWVTDEPIVIMPDVVQPVLVEPKGDEQEQQVPIFPPCPENLQKLTTRQLQLLCGEINKVKRNSIVGYRNKKDKDKQEIVGKIEAFYQTV